jgi:hypothetical protein
LSFPRAKPHLEKPLHPAAEARCSGNLNLRGEKGEWGEPLD